MAGARRPARLRGHPFWVDILVVTPFVIDMAGDATNLYDTISWWDDLNHFVNWAFIRHSPEWKSAYHDTLGDLALGLAGSVFAVAAVAWFGRGGATRPAAGRRPRAGSRTDR
jgi:hypothetical protein